VNDLTPTHQRDAALQAGRVAYRAEHGRWPSRSWKLTPAAPDAPAVPFKSPEREAWEAAYAGPEVGPQGASWPDDGRHVPRMVWKLAFHELTRTSRRAYTPRIEPNH